jgi:GDP-D-mannose dehydratase
MIGRGNASKAEKTLGWKAKYHMKDVVRMMAEAVNRLR